MEVCPPEPLLSPGAGLKQTYSVIHGDRSSVSQSVCQPTAGGLVSAYNAVVVGQGDAAGRCARLAAQDHLGVQERAVGAARHTLGPAGRRLDSSHRPLDARERQLGAEAAVLAPAGGRPLDARRPHLAADGGDRRVGLGGAGRPRQWRSESDLAGSEDAAPRSPAPADSDAADSDSESDQRRQTWRSETHLASAAGAGRGTLSQRHRSQPCLLSALPDYSGVSSRVAAYIQRRRQQDRAARARRRRDSRSPEPPAGDAAPQNGAADAETSGDCHALAARLAAEQAERRERERQLEQLQTEYEQLVTKYAEAETYIDRMRFCRPPGAERPSSEALRPAGPYARDGWDVRDGSGNMISPNEPHSSQSSRFSRLSGIKSAILRSRSDEESSFRRFVQSKKELFPDGVGSKDSSFSDRSRVDLNDSVKNHIEEGHPYDLPTSSVSTAACVDIGSDPSLPAELSVAAGWGPTSAPPALFHPHRHRPLSACSSRTEQTDHRSIPGQGTARNTPGRKPGESPGRKSGESPTRRETRESPPHCQAVTSEERAGKRSSDGEESVDVSSVGRRRSRDESLGDRQRDPSPRYLEKSRYLSSEHRRESGDSGSVTRPESRDLSLEDEQSLHVSPPPAPSVSSRDLSLEQQRMSRDTDSTSPEGKSDHCDRLGLQKLHSLSNSAAGDSVAEYKSISRDQMPKARSWSRDAAPDDPPKSRGSSPTGSRSSLVSESNDPSKSHDPSMASRSRSHVSEPSNQAKSRDPFIASLSESKSASRRRRRSSSGPGYGRRGMSPPASEATEAGEMAEDPPPASRERLHGVLSVLASQVEIIQAMVGQRGLSGRAGRRCRSLSRRISRNRVSVSPGSVVDRVEVVGVAVGRRTVKSGSGEVKRCRSEKAGSGGDPSRPDGHHGAADRRTEEVDWTGGAADRRTEQVDWTGGAADRRTEEVDWTGGRGSGVDTDGPGQDHDKAGVCSDGSACPTRWSADRGSADAPPNRHESARHSRAVGVESASDRDRTPPGRLSAHGSRTSDRSSRRRSPGGGHEAPSVGSRSRAGSQQTRSAGRRRQRAVVPPLPLSELESEQGDAAGSYCSLMSPRTVSPTKKVEQWRARLAEVSPEPPPDPRPPADDHPSLSRPGPELRRLAGAVRGLQRQMSGFCRLVDELRTPGSPNTPGTPGTPGTPRSPGSSEASGPRRRRRYLRERRGLQLPLLPDKPAPPAPPGPVPGMTGRRWDIRRPPARRAASCERAVQTETAVQMAQNAAQSRPAVSRSDGELTTPAAAQQYRDSGGASAHWDRANLLAREVNLRSRCILEGVIRSTAC